MDWIREHMFFNLLLLKESWYGPVDKSRVQGHKMENKSFAL